jgi:hypothetical protein
VRVIVVVEIVGDGESARIDRIAVHGTIAGELVFVALLMFLCRAESEIVLNEQPRDIRLGGGGGDPRNLPVWLIRDAVYAAESFSPRDFGIENQERILLQPPGEKQGCRQRDVALGVVLKACCVLIRRVEFAMIIADRGRLVIEVPSLGPVSMSVPDWLESGAPGSAGEGPCARSDAARMKMTQIANVFLARLLSMKSFPGRRILQISRTRATQRFQFGFNFV